MTVDLILTIYAAALGLVVGSYLNVVAHRLPRGQSTVTPRSACPFCKSLIRPWDNIPVLSFLWLRGRCRRCLTPIAARYPLVEACTGLLFLLCYLRFGPSWAWVAAAAFAALLVALAAIDSEHLILPDKLTLPGIAVGVLAQPWLPWSLGWRAALLGAVVGAALPLLVYGTWYLIRRVEGMGLGDVKMLAMIGAFLGWRGVLVALGVATFSAALVAVTLMAAGRMRMKHRMAFGPYLSLGALLAMFFIEELEAFLPALSAGWM